MSSKKLSRIAIVISISVIVNIFERYLPNISFIPGAKWGFANVIILIATMFFGFKELILIGFLRSLFTSFVIGTFLSIQFYLSVSGSLASVCIMYFFSKKKMFSFIGVSVLGSNTSNLTQILVYSLFTNLAVLRYSPVLMIFSTLTGALTGTISLLLKPKFEKIKKMDFTE